MHNEIPAFLVTDENICGIELPGHLGRAVDSFFRANKLPMPVIEIGGGRRIHIATAHGRALRALESLERCGATVHRNGVRIPIKMSTSTWTNELPPVVVIAAAVRAVTSKRGPGFARFSDEPRAIA